MAERAWYKISRYGEQNQRELSIERNNSPWYQDSLNRIHKNGNAAVLKSLEQANKTYVPDVAGDDLKLYQIKPAQEK